MKALNKMNKTAKKAKVPGKRNEILASLGVPGGCVADNLASQ
jgi:hypothetical protein